LAVFSASALAFDEFVLFDDLPFGTVVTNQYADQGVTFVHGTGDAAGTDNTLTPKDLVVFDTKRATPATSGTTGYLGVHGGSIPGSNDGDPDISFDYNNDGVYGWVGGNAWEDQNGNNQPDEDWDPVTPGQQNEWVDFDHVVVSMEGTSVDDYDNALSDANGTWSGTSDGLVDIPDDYTSANQTRMTFDQKLSKFAMVTIDFDPSSGSNYDSIEFFDGSFNQSDRTAIVYFDHPTETYSFTNPNSVLYDSTVVFMIDGNEDNIANVLPAITPALIGGNFDRVQINVSVSMAWDGVRFTPVPEPNLALFGLLAVLADLGVRRMRR
jgi:hypothetical protein